MTEAEHIKWAKAILKYLVRHIKNYNPHEGGNTYVTYGFLADRIGYPKPHTGLAFGGRIGKTLYYSGVLLDDVRINRRKPPIIQCLVVGKGSKLPSNGYGDDYRFLSAHEKRERVAKESAKVFAYGNKWDKVLDELNIQLSD